MNRIIVLDAGPLGALSNPKSTPANDAAAQWLRAQLSQGALVMISEIADYEVRRELEAIRKLPVDISCFCSDR